MDKDLIKQRIDLAFSAFKSAIQQCPDINRKRSYGGWSVGEIANHIIKGTQTNLGATQKINRPYDLHAASIRDLFLNFQMKFPAAPMLKPDPGPYSKSGLFSNLDRNRDNVLAMIDNDDLTESCIDIQLPVWGALTKYEWLVLFENHIIRHTKQVNDFEHSSTIKK